MICHRSPSTICCLPSVSTWLSMLTTWHPMAWAEVMAKVRFSCFLKRLSLGPLLITRGSIVSGTAKLTSLLERCMNLCSQLHAAYRYLLFWSLTKGVYHLRSCRTGQLHLPWAAGGAPGPPSRPGWRWSSWRRSVAPPWISCDSCSHVGLKE